jgi:photosystem II stability/assembly factor-like uncharacterized protein
VEIKNRLIVFFVFLFVFQTMTFSQQKSIWDQIPDEIKNTNAFKRYEWFYRTRAYPNDLVPYEQHMEEKAMEIEKVEQNHLTEGTSDLWTNLGPNAVDNPPGTIVNHWGSVSGRVRGLAVDPTNHLVAYIGVAAGGIWKTTDGGATWSDLSGSMNRLTFGAIAIDPINPANIYAGTGESRWFFNNVTFEGDGLYTSTDAGATWTHITNGFGSFTQFADIQVSPFMPNIVIAALGSGHWNLGNNWNEGIWRSTDAGATWTHVNTNSDAFDILFDPLNMNVVYATVGNNNASGGFLISTDAGATWNQSNSGLPAPTSIGRMQIALSVSNPVIIYAYIYNNSAFPSGHTTVAYKSTNSGANWSQISAGVNIAGSYNGVSVNDQGSYDLCLAVSPTNSNVVYFGNVELSATLNGSNISFVRNAAGPYGGFSAWDSPMHVDYHKIVFSLSNPSYVYVASDGGIHKSTDGGITWSDINNNVNTLQFYAMASDPNNASIIYGGAQDNGNFSTANKGVTNWTFETTGDGMECFVDWNNSNNIFMSTQNGSLYRSTDGGVNFPSITPSYTYSRAWTAPFWQDPVNPSWIYVASQRILRSTNQGTNWSAISSRLTTSNLITAVAQSSVNSLNLMAVCSYYTTSPTVHKSTDGGFTWSDITGTISAFSSSMIFKVIAHPNNASTFYLARQTYSSGEILMTTDFGSTWSDISGNLPVIPHNDLFVDPANTNHLYAANDFGVYWSSNSGTSWTKLSNGMPFVPAMDFDFWDNGSTRYLRVATHGRGVYEINIDNPLPVELVSFTAASQGDKVLLKWKTASEINNYGFDVERSNDGNEFVKVGFVQGSGNSNSPKQYQFTDTYVNGFLKYRLKQIDNDGSSTYSDIIELEAPKVNSYSLYQNYPNPFNPSTKIRFTIPVESNVKIVISNILGQTVETLVNEIKTAGNHEAVWNPRDVSSGIYFYTINASSVDNKNSFSKTIKMIYME